jgi:hypothetical protein
MGLREELEKRIERKQSEIRDYEDRIREAKAYLQGLQDTLKLIPKDEALGGDGIVLRHGSNIGKAREALKIAGRPLHITEILKAINQPTDKRHRLALGGSLAAYVRRNLIFTRPAPNTFGLADFEPKPVNPAPVTVVIPGAVAKGA